MASDVTLDEVEDILWRWCSTTPHFRAIMDGGHMYIYRDEDLWLNDDDGQLYPVEGACAEWDSEKPTLGFDAGDYYMVIEEYVPPPPEEDDDEE